MNNALELFGARADNADLFKGLGMKSSHVAKAQKFVRAQKGGSLGGRGSTMRMQPGRSSPTGAGPSPPGSARLPSTSTSTSSSSSSSSSSSHANASGGGDNDFTGLI